jgi:hypothetical protein
VNAVIVEERVFYSDADETDLRNWLHCLLSCGKKKLIYSKDTYVYHIGQTQEVGSCEVYVQQTPSLKSNARFVALSN